MSLTAANQRQLIEENHAFGLRYQRVQQLLLPQSQVALISRSNTRRSETEDYIKERFHQAYAANVTEFLPCLVTLSCQQQISAVVGTRTADRDSLFLEQYLDSTIDSTLSTATQHAIAREKICEIGNLVAKRRGASQLLFLLLADALEQHGAEWMTFCATPQVKKIIDRFHCQMIDLGRANSSRLISDPGQWGSYYDSRPHIHAVHLPSALASARKQLIYNGILYLYRNQVADLAAQLNGYHQ
ncbi:thermostable hemolysin [Aurantivibrio plasticivorans]